MPNILGSRDLGYALQYIWAKIPTVHAQWIYSDLYIRGQKQPKIWPWPRFVCSLTTFRRLR